MTKTCPNCHASILSTSQPNLMGTTPELQKMYDRFGGEGDPFNRRQVEAICRAVCGVEGVDPDSDVYGDGCDPQWSRYADAVAAALAATPAVGGEPTVDAVRQTIAYEWGSHVCWHEAPNYDRTCDKDQHCRCADIARAVLSAHSLAAQPVSPLRGRETQETICAWTEATFGTASSNARVASRANEEMAELLRALTSDDNDTKAVEEAADVVIILYRLAHRMGADLHAEIDRKMQINRKREWKVANGHGYHVRDKTASASPPEQPAAVKIYRDALAAANARIAELEDRLSKAAFATPPQRQ